MGRVSGRFTLGTRSGETPGGFFSFRGRSAGVKGYWSTMRFRRGRPSTGGQAVARAAAPPTRAPPAPPASCLPPTFNPSLLFSSLPIPFFPAPPGRAARRGRASPHRCPGGRSGRRRTPTALPPPRASGGHHHDHTAVGGGCAPQVHARSRSALQPERRRSPPPERRPTVHRPRLLLPCGPRRGPCWSPADRRGRPPLRESGGLRWSSSSPSRRAAGRGGISSISSSPPAGLLSANPERTG